MPTVGFGRLPAVIARALLLVAVLAARPAAAAVVWAIDDGEKIRRDDTSLRFETGADNPVWQPGQPIRLFALRDEVVAFQVVIEADSSALENVRVDVAPFEAPGPRAELFIEHFFEIPRASATSGSRESLGWAAGSGPEPGRYTGWVPDALIPMELAPAWDPWPMRIARGQNAVVWIDVTVPAELAPGRYRSAVRVTAGAGGDKLAEIPVELEVRAATLPARPVGTMLFYDRDTLEKRIGDVESTERQLWKLFHAHRLEPLHGVGSVEGIRNRLPALDGSLYTPAAGYTGPAQGQGDTAIILGTYGIFGSPRPESLAVVERLADELAAHKLFDRADVVLYAEDENCTSPRGASWKAALAAAANPNMRRVRVGWTCSIDPAEQPVDVPMVIAGAWDGARVAPARAAGKQVWIYNGVRPATGTMLTDTEAVSMRTLGWIAAMAGIPRWFLWETTAWYDHNNGGHGPYDPFVTAETFHNEEGEAAMGDGVLVYPGKQIDRFENHSLGLSGVIPSIRLKNLRRGIQDAGYLRLARASAAEDAGRIARALFPRILGEARVGGPISWSEHGLAFFQARRALADLIVPGAGPAVVDPGPPDGVGARSTWNRIRPKLRIRYFAALAMALCGGAAVWWWRRRGRATPRT
jgi:hypothetical protein